MRPVHPSWARADDTFVPLPVARREAVSQRDCAVLHRVAITDAQAAKRLRGDGATRTTATSVIACFLYSYRSFSAFAAKLIEAGEPFDAGEYVCGGYFRFSSGIFLH